MQMMLGVDFADLYVFTSSFVLGRPKAIAGSIPLTALAQVAYVGGLAKSRLAILYNDGGFIELETTGRSKAKAFVATVNAHRAH